MKIIDLTLVIEENMIANHPNHPRAPLVMPAQRHDITQYDFVERWAPKDIPPLFDGLPEEVGQWGKGHGWFSEQIIIGGHMGTHIDAAYHINSESKQDASKISLESCYGSAIMLDVSHVCKEQYPITVNDLENAESKTGDKVKEGDIVIIKTNWSKYAYGPQANREKYQDKSPGLEYHAAEFFTKRNVKLVGLDAPNLDVDEVLAAHLNFFYREKINKKPIQIIENLTNLNNIPQSRFTFIALPLPIVGAGGSPVRAVAVID
jgi:arylformamidase